MYHRLKIMVGMFDGADSLNDYNKGNIHISFSSNPTWPYDWSQFAIPLLNEGLVAWYTFDGNASDMSGNGNNGTVNGATLGTDRHGLTNRAYSFDGVDDWIDTPIDSNQEKVSFSVWFKPTFITGTRSVIDSDVRTKHGRSLIIGYGGSAEKLCVQHHNNHFDSGWVLASLSNWQHATVIFSPGQLQFFL